MKELRGVLIITPESLEALFVNKGTAMPAFAAQVDTIVVDQLHSFLGTERAKQVQSQMARLERSAGGVISRVGLSATLGDMRLAADFLRPRQGAAVKVIDTAGEAWSLQLILKVFVDDPALVGVNQAQKKEVKQRSSAPAMQAETSAGKGELEQEHEEEDSSGSAQFAIVNYLFDHLRGSNNLVFPNSRSKVEYYADKLRRSMAAPSTISRSLCRVSISPSAARPSAFAAEST